LAEVHEELTQLALTIWCISAYPAHVHKPELVLFVKYHISWVQIVVPYFEDK